MNNNHTADKTLMPDISEAQHFLKLLDEEGDHFVFETIREPKPKEGKVEIRRYTGTLDEHKDALIKANLKGNGVFITINATDGKGRKSENVNRVRSFFVDLDGSPLEPVMKGALDPHIIIESSPGRYHAYWLVEDVSLDQFEGVQKLPAKQFGGDPSVMVTSQG